LFSEQMTSPLLISDIESTANGTHAVQKGRIPMYARVTIVHIQPEKQTEAVEIYRESVVPAARQQPGFNGAFLLTEPSSNKGYSITFWETEADMKAGETSGYYQAQLAKIASLVAAPPVQEACEVSVQA
jgi:heme-degrading monooxygenase HmoA